MNINKDTFYKVIRKDFPSILRASDRVQSCDMVIDASIKHGLNEAELAYILATTYHETAHTMLPIREYGRGRGRKYGRPHPKTGQVYYGRGFVQLTWHSNYVKATKELVHDFVNNPDDVMIPEYAAEILVVGSRDGWFTTRKLSDTIDEGSFEEFKYARKVINGMDKASMIARYALKFLKAIKKSKVVNEKPLSKSRTMRGSGTTGAAGTAVVIKEVAEAVEKQEAAFTSGDIIMIVIGVIVVGGAIATAYARWCDAGRPRLFGG